jgi:NAD(P)-dependent dehydrogenase (short-subunit alcohol dehydrogenase family)
VGDCQGRRRTGATVVLTFQNERLAENVRELAATLPAAPLLLPCDVSEDAQIAAVFEAIDKQYGRLDFLVHGTAFANREDLDRPFVETSRAGFKLALDISAYSLVALSRGAVPLMEKAGGGSILTLSYLGAQRVFHELQRDGCRQGRARSQRALSRRGSRTEEHPRQRGLRGADQDPGGRRHFRVFRHPADVPRSCPAQAHG